MNIDEAKLMEALILIGQSERELHDEALIDRARNVLEHRAKNLGRVLIGRVREVGRFTNPTGQWVAQYLQEYR